MNKQVSVIGTCGRHRGEKMSFENTIIRQKHHGENSYENTRTGNLEAGNLVFSFVILLGKSWRKALRSRGRTSVASSWAAGGGERGTHEACGVAGTYRIVTEGIITNYSNTNPRNGLLFLKSL